MYFLEDHGTLDRLNIYVRLSHPLGPYNARQVYQIAMNNVVRWISGSTPALLLDFFTPSRILLWRRGRLLLDNLSFLASNLHYERAHLVDHSSVPMGSGLYRPARSEALEFRSLSFGCTFPGVSTTLGLAAAHLPSDTRILFIFEYSWLFGKHRH